MGKPLVILHVIDNLGIGGAQEIIASLVRYGDAEQVTHHCASLHGPGVIGEELKAVGTPVTYLSRHRYHVIAAILRLLHLIQQVQPDVINLHLEYSTLLGLFLKAHPARSRYVVTMHALKQQLPRWFYPVLNGLIQRADCVVVEDHIAEKQISQLNYPSAQLCYIPIGTDYLDRLHQRTEPITGIRAEFNIPPEAPLILNVARFHPSKGQTHLLRAFHQIAAQFPDAYLVVVGGGREETKLRSLAAQLNLGDRIVFAGLRRDLENFYTDADVFAMTALDEGMGVVIYQAMAMQLPIVAYDAGSIREAVQDQETGLLVRCGDVTALAHSLATILSDRSHYRQTYGQAGKHRIKVEFSAETMVRRYERCYLDLLQV